MKSIGKNKVFAYIIRSMKGRTQLLTFRHRDFPDAGIQVPAGSIEPDEDHITALKREVLEESGLQHFDKITYLGNHDFYGAANKELHHRHFYLLSSTEKRPAVFEHRVTGNGLDEKLVFIYKWYDLQHLPNLIAEHGQFCSKINDFR